MKKRLPLIMILIFVLLFCSCGKESKKADISLFSPFYFEGETIRAAFVNKESITIVVFSVDNIKASAFPTISNAISPLKSKAKTARFMKREMNISRIRAKTVSLCGQETAKNTV